MVLQGPGVDPFSGAPIPVTPPIKRRADGLAWGHALAGPDKVDVWLNGTAR